MLDSGIVIKRKIKIRYFMNAAMVCRIVFPKGLRARQPWIGESTVILKNELKGEKSSL